MHETWLEFAAVLCSLWVEWPLYLSYSSLETFLKCRFKKEWKKRLFCHKFTMFFMRIWSTHIWDQSCFAKINYRTVNQEKVCRIFCRRGLKRGWHAPFEVQSTKTCKVFYLPVIPSELTLQNRVGTFWKLFLRDLNRRLFSTKKTSFEDDSTLYVTINKTTPLIIEKSVNNQIGNWSLRICRIFWGCTGFPGFFVAQWILFQFVCTVCRANIPDPWAYYWQQHKLLLQLLTVKGVV